MRRSNPGLALGLGISLGAATLLSAGAASAYCRTSSCDSTLADPHTGAVCNPPQTTDCGIPLAWPQPCTEFNVQQSGSPKLGITAAQLEGLMTTAFTTWMNAACTGGGTPHILVTEGAEVSCDQQEYNQMLGNANIILFHDDVWPYEGSPNTLALTTVTYNLDTGAIYDADMELNSADNHFTLGDTGVEFDLLSIVTHESGHFLGMAHSADATATMYPSYNQGTITLRTLAPDDIAGICTIYPPAGAVTDCDPTPRHGFSPLCASDQTPVATSSGCTCRLAGAPESPRGPWAGALALGALLFGTRRARRNRRTRRPHSHACP